MSKQIRLLLILLAILLPLAGFAQSANFTADVTAGCAPLVVNFTNTTGCSGCTYNWDLGNGTTSTLTSVGGTYTTPGTYTVTLVCHNGSVTTTKTMTITVYPLPTVSFTADDTAVCPGTPVTFTSTSVGGVPGPMTYSWNFGDGGSGTGATTTHTFPGPGYYNVTLSVTNAQGCTKSLTRMAYVHVYNKPVANSTVSAGGYLCNPPAVMTFTGAGSGTPPLTYFWDFGDGSPLGTGTPVAHTYAASGYYTVKVIVVDGNGCTDTLIRPAYVHIGTMTANFTYPATACVGTSVAFANTSSPHTTSTWNFGDGSPTSGAENPIHVFSSPGTYTVTLTVSDGTCTSTITHTITILPAPTGSFTISPERPCPPPVTLTYNATVSPGASVTWNFGDGGTGSGNPATHTYGGLGVFTVVMTMTSADGCVATVTRTDTMYNLLLTVGATPISGCVPLTVNFTASAYHTILAGGPYPYGPNTFSWNFGDGSGPGSGSPTSHTYTAVGTYTAICTVTTGNGCTKTQPIVIHVGAPPAATFIATPTHVCYGKTVTFIPTITSGPVDTFIWSYGDGGSQISSATAGGSTIYSFSYPGIFSVTLTPMYNGCPGVPFVMTSYITVDSPKAIIEDSFSCINKTRVYFKDKSLGDNTHVWMFGDGTTSTVGNLYHDYPSLGSYNVGLATYNIASGCRDTAWTPIELIDLNPSFVADDTTICKWGTVNFTSTVAGGTAMGYRWFVGGITKPWKVNPTLLDTFMATGAYTIMLITLDGHGCYDTSTRPGYIKVAKPNANFNAVPTSGCWPLTVAFTDASTDIAGVSLTSYEWNFGDGGAATATGLTTSHTYTLAGVFDVTEIVTDSYGCKDTAVKPSYITVRRPHAVFTASNTHPCRYTPVLFTNTSVGISSAYWWFGDGATSTDISPTHAYTANGVYTVKLAVTDAFGCHDTAVYTGYINVNSPTAAFIMSDSFSVCPPLNVNFTNLSSGAVGYAWYFGDGNTSGTFSPSNLYISTGSYTVQLVASNIWGCKDTAKRVVSVYGYAGAFSYSPLQGCAPLTVHFSSTVTNVSSIIWDFADGIVASTPTTITDHVYTSPGKYVPKLILSDNTGCQNFSLGIDTIKVDQVTPKFNTSMPVCLGSTLNFVDSSTSYWSTITGWNWAYDGNTSSSSSPSYTFNTVGTYPVTLVVTDGWGCVGTITKNLVVNPLPVIDAGPDTVVCVSDAATLLASGGVSYFWTADPTLSCTACNPTHATPTVPTVYTVTGTDAYGCKGTDTVRVSLRTKTFAFAWPDTAVCRGVPIGMRDTGGTKYTWIPAFGLDNPNIWNPTATPASTVTYTVIAQLASCIPDTDYVKLEIWQLPTVDAGVDQRLLAGSLAQLQATGTNISKYSWSPSGTLTCSTCADPVASMSVTTTYKVDVLSNMGCPASDSVTIYLYCDNSQIFIPNTFTPNGDGQNDVFYPRGKGVKNIKTFRIYNRWGELVYQHDNIDANDAEAGWDGWFKGDPPRPDVYVYLLEADCSTGEPINIKGDVTIIR